MKSEVEREREKRRNAVKCQTAVESWQKNRNTHETEEFLLLLSALCSVVLKSFGFSSGTPASNGPVGVVEFPCRSKGQNGPVRSNLAGGAPGGG